VQPAAPELEYLPAAQLVHDAAVDFAAAMKKPAAQVVQLV